ncbi:pseudouridine synthase, partial [Candidatus Gracilibacteria bacterium]|nr:pseudouridine synthase [Candidatus Gracilibacteria bacterium]
MYEDSHLLVLNKNAGMNVHPGDYKTKESSVITQVQDYLGGKLDSLTFKPSLVHRIDRDTSGVLLVAKKKQILTQLVADFRTNPPPSSGHLPPIKGEGKKEVKKTYYAIVLGKLSRDSGTIRKKLLRIEGAKNENKVQVSEKGQTAITHYKKLAEHQIQTIQGSLIITEVEVT